MRGRRVAATAFVGVLVLLAPALRAQQPTRIIIGRTPPKTAPHLFDLEGLKQWLEAVDAHQPGEFDRPARLIAALGDEKVTGIVLDLHALFEIYNELLGNERSPKPVVAPIKLVGKERFSLKGLNDILGVKSERDWPARFNEILRHGALLHTDIAFLGAPAPVRDVGDRPDDRGGAALVLQGPDGSFSETRGPLAHLTAGRQLLDEIVPRPADDPSVAAWYYATTAMLERQLMMGDALPVVTRGSQLFPQDPRILFYTGVLHEAQASAAFQGVATNAKAKGYTVAVGAAQEELQKALQLFRAAAQFDPRSSEIRLHLGRVTGLVGDHETALKELEVARIGLDEPPLLYYAALFQAAEHEALGAWDAARADLARALELYPDAQSALVALSRLQLRAGDVVGAVAPLTRLFEKGPDDPARDDPWWTYFVSHARNAEELLTDARRALAGGIR